MRCFLLVLCLGVIVAPATSSDLDWDRGVSSANSCFDAVGNDPELAILKLTSANPSAQQLADQSVPSEAEVRIIKVAAARVQPCRGAMLAAVRANHPSLIAVYELRYLQVDAVYEQLLQRRVTFGNANRLLHES